MAGALGHCRLFDDYITSFVLKMLKFLCVFHYLCMAYIVRVWGLLSIPSSKQSAAPWTILGQQLTQRHLP